MRNYRRDLGPRFSEGARLLWAVVLRERYTMRQLREKLGAGPSADVTRWLYGDKLPPLRVIVACTKFWAIAPDAWLADPRRAFVPPAARAA